MSRIATMTALDDTRGAVRIEDVYDTDIHDLWEACTRPERLARWIAQVTGDLHEGGIVHAVFTSTWAGPARIETCDAPDHLLVTTQPDTDQETALEAWLTVEDGRTRLVVEERGLPIGALHFHGAGWQAHLEDLARSLLNDGAPYGGGWSSETPAASWHARWSALTARYQRRSVG